MQKGETLSSIAEVAYGDASLYTIIQKANPNLDPKHLRVGLTINLPEAQTAAHREGGTATSSRGSFDPAKEYKVQPGDSLEKIAQKLYGDSQKWDRIYQANRTRIGPNPHRLKAETVITLPDPPTESKQR